MRYFLVWTHGLPQEGGGDLAKALGLSRLPGWIGRLGRLGFSLLVLASKKLHGVYLGCTKCEKMPGLENVIIAIALKFDGFYGWRCGRNHSLPRPAWYETRTGCTLVISTPLPRFCHKLLWNDVKLGVRVNFFLFKNKAMEFVKLQSIWREQ